MISADSSSDGVATLWDLLEHNLESNGDRVAVIHGKDEVTYAELHARADTTAAWLESAGVGRGDRVGVHLYKSIEEVVAIFAVARLGAAVVNINYQWTVAQLDYVVRDAGIRVLFADRRRAIELADSELPTGLTHILVKGQAPERASMTTWGDVPDGKPGCPKPHDETALAAILYTSGSTGAPKGVMLSHRNLVLGAWSVSEYLELASTDRLLSVLPFSFDYGLNQLLDMCLLGGTTVLQPVAMPSVIAKTLVEQRITGFAAVPTIWIQLTRYLEDVEMHFPALRLVTNSGGKVPDPILEAMPRVFPEARIFLMYGLTEAFRSTYLPPHLFQEKRGSMGRDIPNVETFVINEDGVCGPGEQGELVHRGPLVSMGYWGRPDATDAKIRVCPQLQAQIGDEKVVYSGDIVRIDDDGFYWFVSRADTMIKSSGFRLSPTEVEEILYQSGFINEVVAFGVEDELRGQVVQVAVSAQAGGKLDDKALQDYCRKSMPHYMQPTRFHHWEGTMPRTASGKIDAKNVAAKCKASL